MNEIIKEDLERISSSLMPTEYKRDVLITGGAGFIGSWLGDAFLSLGAGVTCVDDFSGGTLDNIIRLKSNPSFKIIKDDVSRLEITDDYDLIVHCASIPSPDVYVKRPVETMLPNSIALHKLLEYCKKNNSELVYLSTSEIYGDAEIIPTPETYPGKLDPLSIRAPYFESKRFGETLCLSYFKEYGTDVRIARLFNVYGPRLDTKSTYSRVVARFIAQALEGNPITVHGDGMQTRSFCYISDCVVALVKFSILNLKGEVLNIGHPKEIRIIELAHLIKDLTGSKSEIKFVNAREGDPRRRCPDISKAREALNWEPSVSIEDGLHRMISWLRQG